MGMFHVERVHKLGGDKKIRAFVDLTIGGALTVRGFKIFEGEDGPYLKPPSNKGQDGEWYDQASFKSKELKAEAEKVAIAAYLGA